MKGAARVLAKSKAEIIATWVKRVREELPAPNETSDPVLRDHLPLLLEDIITIIERFENLEITSEIKDFEGMLDTSIGHGRHRSSSSGYNVEQVLKEYIILHRIISSNLKQENVYSEDIADILKYIIENSMLYAVVAFNDSLQEMRQKLLGILAHDIRNPASAAYLSIGMLRQEDDPERFGKLRDMSKNSIKRSLDLIEELLESVTVEAGKGMTLHFAEKDLMEYIKSVHSDASEIYSNEIILEANQEKIVGVFDTAMVRRVLENIVNNAVKYGDRGTPVTITVKDTVEDVTIKVHNEGNPIPEKDQKEIFTFLNTTNGSGPKTLKSWGMGLTLVNAVAAAHGGFLELESTKAKGTTFSLLLSKTKNTPGKVKTALNFTYGGDYFEAD